MDGSSPSWLTGLYLVSIFVYVFLNMLRSYDNFLSALSLFRIINIRPGPGRGGFSRLKSFYVVREILFNKSGVCITLLKSLIFQDLILKINICFNAFYDDLA